MSARFCTDECKLISEEVSKSPLTLHIAALVTDLHNELCFACIGAVIVGNMQLLEISMSFVAKY